MKIIKFLLPLLFVVLLLGSFNGVANAADNVVVNTVSIEVANVSTDKSSYIAGDTIQGTFFIGNHSSFTLTDLSYQLFIGDNYTEYEYDSNAKDPKTLIDAGQKIGGVSIAKDGSITVPFTYKVPLFLNGEKLAVHINVFTDSGQLIGWNDSPYISIKNGSSDLKINSARIGLSTGLTFTLGEGPTIYEDTEPKGASILLSVTNQSNSDIAIYPDIVVYEQGDIKNTYNTTGVLFSIEAKEKKDVSIPLPTLSYKPGIYIGGVTLKDKAGNQLATRIEARYIIGGNIATVKNVSTDKETLSQGESFKLSALITGKAPDISSTNGAKNDSGVGSVTISLYNEKNILVAEDKEVFNLSDGLEINKDLIAKVDSKSLRVEVKVNDDSKNIILDYKKNLDDAYAEKAQVAGDVSPVQSKMKLYLEILGIIILIIIGVIYVFARKIKGSSSLMILLVCILGTPALILAAVTCVSIAVSAPYNNQVYVTGSTITVRGTTSYTSCNNNTSSASINITSDFGQSKNLGTVVNNYDTGREDWVYYTSPTFTAYLTAPSTPGNYNVYLTERVTSASSVCDGHTLTVAVPITVVAPTNGSCGSAATVPGDSFPTQPNACSSGTLSSSLDILSTGASAPTLGTKISDSFATIVPNNATSSDNRHTVFDSGSDVVDYSNMNISIPTGATINGIEVIAEGNRNNPRTLDLFLSSNNGSSFTAGKNIGSTFTSSDTTVIAGGPSDTWGREWSASDFSNSNFKLRLDAITATSGYNLNIDQIAVKVYSTPSSPVNTFYWRCLGAYTGTDTSCTGLREASCGTANTGTFYPAPTTNLCLVGTASAVATTSDTNGTQSPSGTYYGWTCTNGSSVYTCSSAQVDQTGRCGGAQGTTMGPQRVKMGDVISNACYVPYSPNTSSLVTSIPGSNTGPIQWNCGSQLCSATQGGCVAPKQYCSYDNSCFNPNTDTQSLCYTNNSVSDVSVNAVRIINLGDSCPVSWTIDDFNINTRCKIYNAADTSDSSNEFTPSSKTGVWNTSPTKDSGYNMECWQVGGGVEIPGSNVKSNQSTCRINFSQKEIN